VKTSAFDDFWDVPTEIEQKYPFRRDWLRSRLANLILQLFQ